MINEMFWFLAKTMVYFEQWQRKKFDDEMDEIRNGRYSFV